MGPEIIVPVTFLVMAPVAVIAIMITRSITKRMETKGQVPPMTDDVAARLERIEQAIDAMSVEIERISEGQRFVTRLLSDRAPSYQIPPSAQSARE